jgi:hypothetical protein
MDKWYVFGCLMCICYNGTKQDRETAYLLEARYAPNNTKQSVRTAYWQGRTDMAVMMSLRRRKHV